MSSQQSRDAFEILEVLGDYFHATDRNTERLVQGRYQSYQIERIQHAIGNKVLRLSKIEFGANSLKNFGQRGHDPCYWLRGHSQTAHPRRRKTGGGHPRKLLSYAASNSFVWPGDAEMTVCWTPSVYGEA